MQISQAGLTLIENFEGYSSARYLDSVGVPTIGYGTTAAVVDPVPETCTREQAQAWLTDSLARQYEPAVNAIGVPLTQNEYDALCSLVYNCGPGVVSAGTSIGSDLRARRYGAAAQDFMLYVRAGGQVLQGLVNRREAERHLFLTPWVDPDPMRYLWFDTTIRDLGRGRHGSERAIVKEYDRKRARWKLFRGRLGRLKDDMGILAGRLESVMDDDPSGAGLYHRPWRKSQLEGRAAGRRYV